MAAATSALWQNAKDYRYKEGDLFLGRSPATGFDVGIPAKRHAITFAGSGAGKGVTVLTPNLLRNSDKNTLTIDPKGELSDRTAQAREDMGKAVHVLDPFGRSSVEEKFLASYNPLDDLELNSLSIGEDIALIADGIVMRHDPRHARWDNNAQLIVAGLIALVKTQAPKEKQNLIEVRNILRTADMAIVAETLAEDSSCGGLMQAAAQALLKADGALSESGEQFLETARENTQWLDNEAMCNVLSSSSFSLSDLKNKKVAVYLVLPPEYLKSHSRFLRLFVRCALSQMQRLTPSGSEKGETCLFLLDEFYSLGKIDEISVSIGQMRSMGLILWPFLQDLGQLVQLYGQDANTFFANSDLHQFFGNTDQETLKLVSALCGTVGIEEIREAPKAPTMATNRTGTNIGGLISGIAQGSKDKNMRATGMLLGGAVSMAGGMTGAAVNANNQAKQEQYQNDMAVFQREMARHGKPRLEVDEVAALIQTKTDVVSDHSINILFGSERLLLKPAPYFRTSKMNTFIENVRMWGLMILVFAVLQRTVSAYLFEGQALHPMLSMLNMALAIALSLVVLLVRETGLRGLIRYLKNEKGSG